MKINESNAELVKVTFADKELLLVGDMIINSFSGGFDWIVSPNEYYEKFGISYERAEEIFRASREQWDANLTDEEVILKIEELQAIINIVEYMLTKWDDSDFRTIVNAPKTAAIALLSDLKQLVR